ncbi:MAG: S49 family peptidase, partial [Planctomycetaceae bacterium]
LARGRVYTGRQALAIGLVDQLGTLADAIAHARTLAGDTNSELELEQLPKGGSPLESLLGQTQRAASPVAQLIEQLPESLRPAVRHLPVLELMTREPVLLHMPFDLKF